MPSALIVAWTATVMLQSPAPQGDEASIAMRANLSLIRDIEFVFEGRFGLANADDKPEIRAKAAPDDDYQGTYAYRTEDGATLLDVYHQPRRENALLRRTMEALLKSKIHRIDQTPDNSRKTIPASIRNGGPGSFNTTTSPEPFVPFWIFREILLDPSSYRYEPLGWEEIDGRRCRKVQVNEFYQYDLPEPRRVVYWIDLERGGLPLKIEYIRNGLVTRRTHDVRLISIKTAEGHLAWVPVGGVSDFFSKQGEVVGGHFVRDTCQIVSTSIRINQGLTDNSFSVRRDLAGSSDEVVQKARRRFEAASPVNKAKIGGLTRTDPKGVSEKLAENLAVADSQAKEIEASSVAREASRSPSPSTLMLAVAVPAALLIAFLAWRRRR